MLLRKSSRWWLGSVFILFTGILLYNIFYYRWTGSVPPPWIDLDEEWNVPTFFSALVFLSISFPLVSAIRRFIQCQQRLPAFLYSLMGVLILFLIADELFLFHDGSGRAFFTDYCDWLRICFNGAEWVWFYLPIALVIGAFIITGLRRAGMRTEHNRLFVMSLLLFFSVFIIEWVEPAFSPYANDFQEWVEIVAAILFYMHIETEAAWQQN